jgi:dTMP kinase
MFITFEGIDGCGKSTQIKLLAEYLDKKGVENIIIREPGGTDFSEKIREILLYSKDDINTISEMLLFETARADSDRKDHQACLGKGSICTFRQILRFDHRISGLWARSAYRRAPYNSQISNFWDYMPDITIYLDLPLSESKKRIGKKSLDRMEKAGDAFFKRVINGFRDIAKNEPQRVKMIDAKGGIAETHHRILNLLMLRTDN